MTADYIQSREIPRVRGGVRRFVQRDAGGNGDAFTDLALLSKMVLSKTPVHRVPSLTIARDTVEPADMSISILYRTFFL